MNKLVLILACLPACMAPPVESPVTTVVQETDVTVTQNAKNKVDILFMIDNSTSMSPRQGELRKRASATSSRCLKISPPPGPTPTCTSASSPPTTAPATRPAGGCDASPGGQHGYLQDRRRRRRSEPAAHQLRAADGRAQHHLRGRPRWTAGDQPTHRQRLHGADQRVHLHGVGGRGRLRLRAPARVRLCCAPACNPAEGAGFSAQRRAPRRGVRDQRGRRPRRRPPPSSTRATPPTCTARTPPIGRLASPWTVAACKSPTGWRPLR